MDDRLDRTGYRLAFEERFDGAELDSATWLPFHLPHWSSREAAVARYRVQDGLTLRVDADQPPWWWWGWRTPLSARRRSASARSSEARSHPTTR